MRFLNALEIYVVNIIRHFPVDQERKLVKLYAMTVDVFLWTVLVMYVIKNVFDHKYSIKKLSSIRRFILICGVCAIFQRRYAEALFERS